MRTVPVPIGPEVSLLRGNIRGRWVVCWYRKVEPNSQGEAEPHVRVSVRTVDDNGNVGQPVTVRVGLTHLGHCRLGSILDNGRTCGEFELATECFPVVFTDHCVEPSFSRLAVDPGESFPWLGTDTPAGPVLRLPIPRRRTLWIPCLEFFSRCYGWSQEVNRILASYEWTYAAPRLFAHESVHSSRRVVQHDSASPPAVWRIQYGSASGSGLVDEDVVFLAHVLYDAHARDCACDPYVQLQNARFRASGSDDPAAYLKIRPWFLGKAELLVRGLHLPDGDFLALRVDGCTEPAGVPIQRVVQVVVPADDDRHDDDAEDPDDPSVSIRRRRVDPRAPVLTGRETPDPHSAVAAVPAPDFQLLGVPRDVLRERVPVRRDGSVVVRGSRTKTGRLSSGESDGTRTGADAANIFAPLPLESRGVVRDVWNAFLYLKRVLPDRISSVAWFTPETGFRIDPEPQLMPFPLVRSRATRKVLTWSRMYPKEKQPLRGLLVLRVGVCPAGDSQATRLVYLVEIQRRWTLRGEEKFSGLVFDVKGANHQLAALFRWLDLVRVYLVQNRGVFDTPLIDTCPGQAFTFQHWRSGKDRVPGEAAVSNALRQMNLELPV